MHQEGLAKVIEQTSRREQRRQADEAIETQIRVLSAVFDKSVAYANLMIVAAYAGFFGMWQLTKDLLEKKVVLWSALLMLISVTTFVAFEVIKMIYIQHNIRLKLDLMKRDEVRNSPLALTKAFQELAQVQERVGLYLMGAWKLMLLVAVFTGMSAAGLIGYGFVTGLAK